MSYTSYTHPSEPPWHAGALLTYHARYTTSYLQHGHELIHNNIQLLLIRTLPIPQNTATSRDPPAAPEPSTLQPLDPSGGYVLQASVRAAEQKQEITNIGIKELTDLRTTLKGVVEMEVGDRLALDTRMR
jgi:mediator of RNA polymerase II transcription subunit 18